MIVSEDRAVKVYELQLVIKISVLWVHCDVLQLSYATKHVEHINGACSLESPADSPHYTGKV